jgi:hypothetical protein
MLEPEMYWLRGFGRTYQPTVMLPASDACPSLSSWKK